MMIDKRPMLSSGGQEDRERKGLYTREEEGEYTNEESEGIHKPCYDNIQKRSTNPPTSAVWNTIHILQNNGRYEESVRKT